MGEKILTSVDIEARVGVLSVFGILGIGLVGLLIGLIIAIIRTVRRERNAKRKCIEEDTPLTNIKEVHVESLSTSQQESLAEYILVGLGGIKGRSKWIYEMINLGYMYILVCALYKRILCINAGLSYEESCIGTIGILAVTGVVYLVTILRGKVYIETYKILSKNVKESREGNKKEKSIEEKVWRWIREVGIMMGCLGIVVLVYIYKYLM